MLENNRASAGVYQLPDDRHFSPRFAFSRVRRALLGADPENEAHITLPLLRSTKTLYLSDTSGTRRFDSRFNEERVTVRPVRVAPGISMRSFGVELRLGEQQFQSLHVEGTRLSEDLPEASDTLWLMFGALSCTATTELPDGVGDSAILGSKVTLALAQNPIIAAAVKSCA